MAASSTGETFEHIIHKFVNPVTRNVIKLVPPAECMDQEEYDALLEQFSCFCEESWKQRKDPDTIDPRLFRPWGES